MNLNEGQNTIVFLLVQEDHVTPVGDIDVADIRLAMSTGGETLQEIDTTITAMGSGWFHADVTVPPGSALSPVVFVATYPGSPQWRDIHQVSHLENMKEWVQTVSMDTQTAITDLGIMLDQGIKDMAAGFQAMADNLNFHVARMEVALAEIRNVLINMGAEFPVVLQGVHVATGAWEVPEPNLTQFHLLVGEDLWTGDPVVTQGNLDVVTGEDNLLLPGEELGPELAAGPWGTYDDQQSFTLIDSQPDKITFRLDLDGRNQQVWKTASGVLAGDYVFQFRVDSLDSGDAEVYVRHHRSPYTVLGFSEQIPSGTAVRQRVRVEPIDPQNPVRLQFQVGGLHLEPETYTISEVSFRRITRP